jgi:hypothetical protein
MPDMLPGAVAIVDLPTGFACHEYVFLDGGSAALPHSPTTTNLPLPNAMLVGVNIYVSADPLVETLPLGVQVKFPSTERVAEETVLVGVPSPTATNRVPLFARPLTVLNPEPVNLTIEPNI